MTTEPNPQPLYPEDSLWQSVQEVQMTPALSRVIDQMHQVARNYREFLEQHLEVIGGVGFYKEGVEPAPKAEEGVKGAPEVDADDNNGDDNVTPIKTTKRTTAKKTTTKKGTRKT